eukprot:TRINITY_DN20421_c0_g1_i1.p4 TRINITY_DN20421_c0_g1~~TRINITY_DN20421_c0_g1_i1.p4  ORF type:complete len:110 (-),score=5.62 TRINITY_DN20421_c0_g1_i1:555-884(-)
MHVLLVLQQGAVQGRNAGAGILAAQGLGRNVLGQQQLEPVQQFRGGGLLLQPGHFAQAEEHFQGLLQQFPLQFRVVHGNDLLHGLPVGETDVVEETAAQEGVGQFLFVV